MKTYTFKLSHDNGSFKLSTYATDLETAQNMVMNAEGCPLSALKLISEVETLYKVVKFFRVSGRREILRRGLTIDEAKRVVNNYPDSNRSLVGFEKQ